LESLCEFFFWFERDEDGEKDFVVYEQDEPDSRKYDKMCCPVSKDGCIRFVVWCWKYFFGIFSKSLNKFLCTFEERHEFNIVFSIWFVKKF